jgi:adenosylcobinamide-phosphate synthase
LLLVKIAIAFILDYKLGDPGTLYHPVQAIGALIAFLEKLLRKGIFEKFFGILLVLLVLAITYLITWYLVKLSWALEVFLAYTILAARSLAKEAKLVYNKLQARSISQARKQIAMLVSRDTKEMNKTEIIKATVETVAENTVDGVAAPLFFMFIGGVPLAMVYKAINTLDSMVGYKSEKYINFGWASAKLDDLFNFIPARITSFIVIPCAAFICRFNVQNAIKIVRRDRFKHSSPNSGHPEAAVAGALGCQLGGPTSYFGFVQKKPFIGDKLHKLTENDILKTIKLMYCSAFIFLIMGILVRLLCKFMLKDQNFILF